MLRIGISAATASNGAAPVRNHCRCDLFAATTLTLGVLIPTADSESSRSIRASVGAVSLAVNAIKNSSYALLHGKRLEVVVNEVSCDSTDSMAAINVMIEENNVAAIIGPVCSVACESTGYLTAALKTVQISYSCNSPLMSDKLKYPTVSLFLVTQGSV